MTRTPLQGNQAALLTAALMCEAGAAVTLRTYWAWETTARLRLLGGARGAGVPTGEERRGAYGISRRTAYLLYLLLLGLGLQLTVLMLSPSVYHQSLLHIGVRQCFAQRPSH